MKASMHALCMHACMTGKHTLFAQVEKEYFVYYRMSWYKCRLEIPMLKISITKVRYSYD